MFVHANKTLLKQKMSEKALFVLTSMIYLQSISNMSQATVELLQEGIFFLLHLFTRDVLAMKKLEIEKPKPTFSISVLKVEY